MTQPPGSARRWATMSPADFARTFDSGGAIEASGPRPPAEGVRLRLEALWAEPARPAPTPRTPDRS
jgi:hypothetical protein